MRRAEAKRDVAALAPEIAEAAATEDERPHARSHGSKHAHGAHPHAAHGHAAHGHGHAAPRKPLHLSEPLRIMTYNVRYFGHATRGLASTGNAIKRIAASIARMDPTPDLICLQEVETQSIRSTSMTRLFYPEETQLDRLMTELYAALRHQKKPETFTAYYFPAHAYRLTKRTNIYTTGLAVLAKDTLSVGHHNAESPHDITHRRMARRLKQTRICAHVAFERKDGLTFDVFNTHLSLPSFLTKAFWTGDARMGFGKNQVGEAQEILAFVERAKKSDNFLIVGDFNSLPGSPVDRLLREEGGLVDAFRAVHEDPSDLDARAFGTAGFLNLRMHLDHVYSSRHTQWLDFAGTRRFGEEGDFDGLSDHVPLIARCRMPL
jgi:endonuclease/exonuclease/phosphatase family metal-dependent hydrolase